MARRRNRWDRLRPLRLVTRGVETAQAKRLGWTVLSRLYRTPVLVLVTTGRRSGRTRETTLAFQRLQDGSLVVVGGAGGQDRTPDWVANLRANPRAAVIVDRDQTDVRAIELDVEEREELWPDLRQVWPQIDAYARRSERTIPVFRLVGLGRRATRSGEMISRPG